MNFNEWKWWGEQPNPKYETYTSGGAPYESIVEDDVNVKIAREGDTIEVSLKLKLKG